MAQIDFSGTWKLDRSSDNIDDFWNAIAEGASFLQRQGLRFAKSAKPTSVILQEGDHIKIETKSPIRNRVNEYDIGVTVEEEQNGGYRYRVTLTWDGNKLKTELIPLNDKGIQHTIHRELVDDEMVMNIVMPTKNVDVKRYFKKQIE